MCRCSFCVYSLLGCVDNNCNGEIGPLSLYDNTRCAGVHFVFKYWVVLTTIICNGEIGPLSLYDNTRYAGVQFVFILILGCVDNNCNGEIGPLSLYDNTRCAGVHFVFILGCVDNNNL